MVARDPPVDNYGPLAASISRMKTVPLEGDTVRTVRALGISFGE